MLIQTFYSVGLFRAWSWVDLDVSTVVYPRPIPAGPVGTTPSTNDDGDVLVSDGIQDFYGLREYQNADSPKHIAWKSYARTDELLTKQYAAYADRRVWLTWDSLPGLDREARLSHLCYWCVQLSKTNDEYGLRIPGVEIEPGRGQAHRDKVLKELSLFEVGAVTGFQIPGNSLAWLLAAQVAVIAPHAAGLRLPVGVILLCVCCGLWRIMVYQGRCSYLGRWAKVFIVFGGIVGVGFGYRTFMGLDPWVGLLVTAFALKLLEMHNKRDAYVVILLGYFVALTEFLYEQSIPYTYYMLLVVTMITAALIGLNQTRSHLKPVVTFKLASVLLLQSIPLMIVLFLLFPRLAPLWTVPLNSSIARTGVTDVLSMGNIAQLTQDDSLAFRATFEGGVPSTEKLYWRVLVLSAFDDNTWERPDRAYYRREKKGDPYFLTPNEVEPSWAKGIERQGEKTRYSIIMEPTNQRWMFTLTMPEPINDEGVGMLRDYYFVSFQEVSKKFRYEVTSDLKYRMDSELDLYWRSYNTLLPQDKNPRARELAAGLRAQSESDAAYVAAVLRMLSEQEFIYTLKPPALGENTIDDFLLETRAGFCEHFASSFAFLMRAAGVPARVVVGYQGGEYNPIGDYVAVRQFDAHAWTEVWLEGIGWMRVDPTAIVAPDRIDGGLELAVAGENTFLSDVILWWLKYGKTLWLTEIRLQLSAIAHYWDSWVVGYTPDMQVSILSRYLGDVDRKKIGMIMLSTFFSLLAVIGFLVLRKKATTPLSAVDKEYLKFCQMLSKLGLARNLGEGPIDYA